jgi:aspartate carbamoyltransferase regulatory subunit
MNKKIGAIQSGINLDHIRPGNAWYLIQLLGLQQQYAVGIGLNLPSKRMGVKDLLKVENFFLSSEQLQLVSVFAYGATYSIIQDYQVISKTRLELPERVLDLIICPNHRCISQQYKSWFKLKQRNASVVAICHYCENKYALSSLTKFKLEAI